MEDKEIELQVRRVLSAEVVEHRKFLQDQFKHLTWGIGVLLAFGAVVFAFLFGKSISDTKEQLITTIDAKVIEYRIVESFKKTLKEQIDINVSDAVESEETIKTIDQLVGSITNKYVKDVSEQIEIQLKELVRNEVEKNQDLTISELISKVSFPAGAVVAFNDKVCPSGWRVMESAKGRYIVGVNSPENILATVGNALSDFENRPTGNHTHNLVAQQRVRANYTPGGRGDIDWYEHTYSTTNPNPQKGMTFVDGTNAPYIQLLVCEKI
ncbi:hypothetical protein ACP54H_000296 [Vibrio alginolyticus]